MLWHNLSSVRGQTLKKLTSICWICGVVVAVAVVNAVAFSIKPERVGQEIDGTQNQLLSLAAFVAYLGFLNVLVAHSHPVMLVFCHLLINRNSDRGLEESLPRIESSGTSRQQRYREGMLCFSLSLSFFFSFVVLSNGHRSKKYWNKMDKTGCLFFSQCPASHHLSGAGAAHFSF